MIETGGSSFEILLTVAALGGLGLSVALERARARSRQAHAEVAAINRDLEAIVDARTRELSRSERKYRSLVGQASVGILLWDPESLEILESNAHAGELLGRRPDVLLGERVDRLFAEPDRERVRRALARVANSGGAWLSETQLVHPERGPLAAEVSASLVRFGDEAVVLALVRDLSESKALERRSELLMEQMRRNEKEASIGALAAGVAHEINNPMSYLASNLNRLVEYSKRVIDHVEHSVEPRGDASGDRGYASRSVSRGEVRELVSELEAIADESREGVERVIDIVQALLEFAHGGQGHARLQPVDLNRVVRNCLKLVPRPVRERVDLDLEPVPPVPGHPMQIAQVLMNLIVNATHALATDASETLEPAERPGRVRVSTRASARCVHLSVEDDGCGIEEAHLAQIFDPFFTTKPVGRGTGLGLAVSLEIVRRHSGNLWVDSADGRGSLFVLELPIQPEKLADDEAPAENEADGDEAGVYAAPRPAETLA